MGRVEFMEVPLLVNHYDTLQGPLRLRVVTDHVVREIVEHLEREEEAGIRNVSIPVKYALVHDLNLVRVWTLRCLYTLQFRKRRRNLNDSVFCTCIDVGIRIADVVQDVTHHGTIPGAHLVDDEVVIGEERQFVVLDKVPRDGFAIVGLEELCGCVPELADVGGVLSIECVLEGRVGLPEIALEIGFVNEGGEVEGVRGGEDDGVFGEVTVVGIV